MFSVWTQLLTFTSAVGWVRLLVTLHVLHVPTRRDCFWNSQLTLATGLGALFGTRVAIWAKFGAGSFALETFRLHVTGDHLFVVTARNHFLHFYEAFAAVFRARFLTRMFIYTFSWARGTAQNK